MYRGGEKSQRATNITDVSLTALLHTELDNTFELRHQKDNKPAQKVCFLHLCLLEKGRGEKIKRKLAYLGSSHQEIIH